MAEIKYEIDQEAIDAALEGGGPGYEGEPPRPGIYKAKIHDITPGYSKGEDDKPDKSRPRLEVVYEIIGDSDGDECEYDGARLWDYVSFSKAAAWKLAQFLVAIGQPKAKGKINTDKAKGKVVKLRVTRGSYQGEYSPDVGGSYPWEGDADERDELDDIEAELEEASEDEDELYDEDELEEMSLAEVKKIAKSLGVAVKKGKRQSTYIKEILEAQEGEDEDEEESEDDFDWDESDEEEEPEFSAEDIRNMEPAELKGLAKEQGVSLKGMKLSEAKDALIESLGLEDEDEDDVPF